MAHQGPRMPYQSVKRTSLLPVRSLTPSESRAWFSALALSGVWGTAARRALRRPVIRSDIPFVPVR